MTSSTNLIASALIATLASSALAADGYLSQPALFNDRLCFVSERDLWTARLPADPTLPVVAYRLTNGAGVESHPIFSPYGTRIAFTAEYEGNIDVYVMPIDGGQPTRLTFHPDSDEAISWTPDGKSIAFRSPRANPLGHMDLWTVDATGGLAQPIPAKTNPAKTTFILFLKFKFFTKPPVLFRRRLQVLIKLMASLLLHTG